MGKNRVGVGYFFLLCVLLPALAWGQPGPPGGVPPKGPPQGGQGCPYPGQIRVHGECGCPSGTTLCGSPLSCVSNVCGADDQLNPITCNCECSSVGAACGAGGTPFCNTVNGGTCFKLADQTGNVCAEAFGGCANDCSQCASNLTCVINSPTLTGFTECPGYPYMCVGNICPP
jgi:hypothetical protein